MSRNSSERHTSSVLKMTNAEFSKLSKFILGNWGINLPIDKKLLLEGRLRARLKALNMNSFKEYCKYLFSPEGQKNEPLQMIDLVSTNKTDFFREPDHFVYLEQKILPKFKNLGIGTVNNPLKIWSAGCSSGQEPYTMAMVLKEFGEKNGGFKFSILATDISARILKKAKMAIYPASTIEPITMPLRKKYILKSKDEQKKDIRICQCIRNCVKFSRLNLMELEKHIKEKFHIIFCRNVIIYFDRETQEKLLAKYYDKIYMDGYMFLGHSEALAGRSVTMDIVSPMVYHKTK